MGYEPSGALVDVSTDPRTVYTVDRPECAEIADTNLLVIKAAAAACTSVTVSVQAYGLGAAVRGQPLSPPEPIGVGPLTNVDAFHVALAAAQACLGRAIDEARAPRARAKRA